MPLLGVMLYGGLWAATLIVRNVFPSEKQVVGAEGPNSWLLFLTAALTGGVAGFLFLPYSLIVDVSSEVRTR